MFRRDDPADMPRLHDVGVLELPLVEAPDHVKTLGERSKEAEPQCYLEGVDKGVLV